MWGAYAHVTNTPRWAIIYNPSDPRGHQTSHMSKSYTMEEVAKHNSPEDLWIVIDGGVFDVTEWQKDHPGGKKMLQKVGGKDATKFFHKYHDVDNVMRKFGNKFRIGSLSGDGVSSNKTSALTPNKVIAEFERLDEFGDMIPYADPLWYQGYYSPYHNETHAKLRDLVRAYVEEKLMPFVDEWEEKGEIPQSVYKDIGQAGFLALTMGGHGHFPAEYAEYKFGDILPYDQLDPFHSALVSDEFCRAASGGLIWFLVGGFGIGLPPLLNYGSEELKKRVVPGILAGDKRICLAITEPRGGSDVANLDTEAVKTPDGKHFIVNGTKKWITNGIWADYFSVAVRTGGPGMNGISMLLIERTMPGIHTRKLTTQGVRTSGSTYIEFEDVKVPVENLLGEENAGFKVIMANFNQERMGVITQAVRFSRVCYEEAIKWAHQRETFGVKLIKHDVIRNKLAQMACRIEACQSLFDSLAFQYSQMDADEAMLRLGGNIAGLKAFSTQTFELCAREATQIFGGLGYTQGGKGGKVERLYRDVRSLAIPGGSEEIMLDLSIRQNLKVHQLLGAKL